MSTPISFSPSRTPSTYTRNASPSNVPAKWYHVPTSHSVVVDSAKSLSGFTRKSMDVVTPKSKMTKMELFLTMRRRLVRSPSGLKKRANVTASVKLSASSCGTRTYSSASSKRSADPNLPSTHSTSPTSSPS